jgi:periplasmic divalent cation tolerance protein
MAHIVVLMTAGRSEEAATIARALVNERLAACVNLLPGITSCYRWEGRVAEDAEILLVAKTRTELFEALARRVRELHSYATPEIIAVPVVAGSPDYLQWIDRETG